VGHIDLMQKFCYIEVPERDARRVMQAIDGKFYKNRQVRCNPADSATKPTKSGDRGSVKPAKSGSWGAEQAPSHQTKFKKEDWMKFLHPEGMRLKGEKPDFTEEGWARRKKRK